MNLHERGELIERFKARFWELSATHQHFFSMLKTRKDAGMTQAEIAADPDVVAEGHSCGGIIAILVVSVFFVEAVNAIWELLDHFRGDECT